MPIQARVAIQRINGMVTVAIRQPSGMTQNVPKGDGRREGLKGFLIGAPLPV